MGGANGWGNQGTRNRANNGNNNIDTKRMMGSRSNGGNERTVGMKAMGKGEGAMG